MSMPVVFRKDARIEFDKAIDWYEQKGKGLGIDLAAEIQKVIDRIAARPDYYPPVWNDVREALVQRFPYCIYYRDEPGQVLVLAVFHTSRDEAIWQRRA